ncbi:putative 6-phosphofructokinase [Rosa chinensis]|uniref:Putative 6-phosphofructokinase n=1 Tax=Rosa chinensis TaxID=74649 RepID=A0A2P6PMA6_ROSCH|nr:putative 6-phosphofructokinase [Rosa chinensis]
MVIVIVEGAGQGLISERLQSVNQQDASGNKLLKDVGFLGLQDFDHLSMNFLQFVIVFMK